MAVATSSKTGFHEEAFGEFLKALDEPDWLIQARREAWQQFDQLPLPSGRDEEWMRTDIRTFKLDRFGLPGSPSPDTAPPPALLDVGVDLGGQTLVVDSFTREQQLAEKWRAQGVLFGSLSTLAREHSDLLQAAFRRRIVDPHADKFAALNAACWHGGTLLYVPRGVRVEEPLHLFSVLSHEQVDLAKTLVILDEGAEATLLAETASTSPDGGGLHCGSVELSVGAGAHLRYVNLQNWGDRVWHFAHQRAAVGRAASLQWTIGALGARLAKVNQHVVLEEPDADVEVNGVMFTTGRQHLSYNTLQHHHAGHCHSNLLYKAALQDDSRTVWRGMIKVEPEAQRTDAYQRNDNLMLSAEARADSIPGLEIEADDVRCTHGSTSGRVDDHQLFYAMTRGYTRREAVRMIVTDFFQQVFDRVTIPSVREALGQAIGQRVRDLDDGK